MDKRRIVSLMVAIVLAVGAAGCSINNDEIQSAEEKVMDINAAPEQLSWSGAAYARH